VLGVSTGTAEEFYSACLSHAQILEAAARRHGAAGDAVSALADAWSADLNMLQAVMWERILVASRTPQRQFFQGAEAVVSGLLSSAPIEAPTVGRLVAAARSRMAAAFDEGLTREMAGRWPDLTYLELLPPPSEDDLTAAVRDRLGGLSSTAFVDRRRVEAQDMILAAQGHRVRGETAEAIRQAYEADFRSLEAYLVESAVSVGDRWLLTVTARWDLVVHAISEVPGLPDDFAGAMGRLRAAIAGALGEADGTRLLAGLPAL
jgi:hypothetical protein